MIKNLNHILDIVIESPPKTLSVAAAEDIEVLEVAEEAVKRGIADFILVGDKSKIEDIAGKYNKDCSYRIIDEPNHAKAAYKAVELVRTGEAHSVMKGLLHTGTFLKAVVDKERGLNTGKLISQISVLNKPNGDGLLLVSDCAMNINPGLQEKKQITENCIELAHKLGLDNPKVAFLSALENVNPAMPATLDAAILSKMGDRGQISGATFDGPLALDNAISREAAERKGISSEVAGNADILIVPDIQVGNILHKAITFIAQKDVGAAVMGAEVPIVMTSRTDSARNKILAVALTCLIA